MLSKFILFSQKYIADKLNPTGNGWYGDSSDAQEAILTPYFFVVDLICYRDDNPQYKKLLETYEIDIIPIINPWGVQKPLEEKREQCESK